MTTIKITTEKPEVAALLIDIMIEVERAEAKHPIWPTCHIKQIAIIAEEAGELIREGNLIDEGAGTFAQARKEAIETAATCIRFLTRIKQTEEDFNQPAITDYFNDPSYSMKSGLTEGGSDE